MKQMIWIAVLAIAVLVTGCTPAPTPEVTTADFEQLSSLVDNLIAQNVVLEAQVVTLQDHNAVEKVANNLFIQTDNMDWDALVADVFTETVYFDMTSVGGTAGDVSSADIVAGWDQGFQVIEAVQHQSGNMQIDVSDQTATVFQYGTATQYATTNSGNNTRTFFGSYDIGLVKDNGQWKVNAFAFNLKMMDGNVGLE